MSKLYVVVQDQYQEENFGDLAGDDSIIHGVFTKDKALEVANKLPIKEFHAQFGSGIENVRVLPVVVDELIDYADWYNQAILVLREVNDN